MVAEYPILAFHNNNIVLCSPEDQYSSSAWAERLAVTDIDVLQTASDLVVGGREGGRDG